MTEADLAKTLEGLSAAATQGEWGIWREPISSRHDAIAELTEQVDATKSISDALVLLDAGGLCPASTGCGPTSDANAEFITALVNTYRTGQLIVVDHPQATSPVDDRGWAICEQQAVEAVARAIKRAELGNFSDEAQAQYVVNGAWEAKIPEAATTIAQLQAELAEAREVPGRIVEWLREQSDKQYDKGYDRKAEALSDAGDAIEARDWSKK